MTWLKCSDTYGDELAGLSDAAFRTHTEALLWVMRRETGGDLTTRDVRRFAETADPDAAVQELLDLGLWVVQGAGYRVLHHLEHQPTPEVLQARRRKDAARQARHRSKAAGLDVPQEQEDPSRRDTSRDTPSDDPRDPGRDGTGRVGTGTPTPQRQEELPAREVDEPTWPTPAPVPAAFAPAAPAAPPPAAPASSRHSLARCQECASALRSTERAAGVCSSCAPTDVAAEFAS